jgi:hypothetical protein
VNDLARRLEQSSSALSARVVQEMYEDRFWLERFGQRGLEHSQQDGRFHVSYLVQALIASDPGVLTRYARWLRSLLTTRGMCTLHLAENFERLARATQEQVFDSARAVEYLRAARAALLDDAGPARELQLASERIVAQICARDGEPSPSLGATPAREARAELLHLLSYLTDALWLGRSEHFLAHVRWLRGFLQRQGVRDGQLEAWLEALASCVAHDDSLSPGLREAAGRALSEARAALAPELAQGVAPS